MQKKTPKKTRGKIEKLLPEPSEFMKQYSKIEKELAQKPLVVSYKKPIAQIKWESPD